MKSGNKKRKIVLSIILVMIIVIAISVGLYLSSYYEASQSAAASLQSNDTVTVTELDNGDILFEPTDAKVGLVFYPGGKVEHTAYSRLMHSCAENGILCILVKMPFHLAVLDIDAAKGITDDYPDVSEWYIGGHSLGGSMAATYLADHTDEYQGLFLLGSYSTKDLSNSDNKVLSIYGSEDKVLNMENYRKNLSNLPSDFEEVVIDGGCHAYFGMYGHQEGDGTPVITNEEQINITADEIIEFIEGY